MKPNINAPRGPNLPNSFTNRPDLPKNAVIGAIIFFKKPAPGKPPKNPKKPPVFLSASSPICSPPPGSSPGIAPIFSFSFSVLSSKALLSCSLSNSTIDIIPSATLLTALNVCTCISLICSNIWDVLSLGAANAPAPAAPTKVPPTIFCCASTTDNAVVSSAITFVRFLLANHKT